MFTEFLTRLLTLAEVKALLSDEHFSMDGTLIEAWASPKSIRSKDGSDGNDSTNFHGQTQKTTPMPPQTIPIAGSTARPPARGQALLHGPRTMENRNGLAVAGMARHASGTAERRAAEKMSKTKTKQAGHSIAAARTGLTTPPIRSPICAQSRRCPRDAEQYNRQE